MLRYGTLKTGSTLLVPLITQLFYAHYSHMYLFSLIADRLYVKRSGTFTSAQMIGGGDHVYIHGAN